MRRTARGQTQNPIVVSVYSQRFKSNFRSRTAIKCDRMQFRQRIEQGKQIVLRMLSNFTVQTAGSPRSGNDVPQSNVMSQQ